MDFTAYLASSDIDGLVSSVETQLFDRDAPVDRADHDRIHAIIRDMDAAIAACERAKLRVGILHDLIQLKNQGFSGEELRAFYEEDREFLAMADAVAAENRDRRDYMFGYPANMQDDSFCTQYLREIESHLYLMNNCGDPYQRGHYGMDSKELEQKIITMIADNLGIHLKDCWGYITSGGTEGNYWAIREGCKRLPGARVYFSADAHYSIEKYVSDMERTYTRVPTDKDGRMDTETFRRLVEDDPRSVVDGVMVILTWGTTCTGAIDDVAAITRYLDGRNIPYFCHLDAAHYGGIPGNQQNAPILRDVESLGVDTVAVSFHKYIGTSRVNGIVLALTERRNRGRVDYIGQEDTTLLGSRDYFPLSTYQRVKETMCRTSPGTYERNVAYFERLLRDRDIPYSRAGQGNIFVIDQPSDEICNAYQLADFTDATGRACAHIIIFPFHKESIMRELADRLAREREDTSEGRV